MAERAEIEQERRALLGVLVAITGPCTSTLPRRLHRAALRILRPAEWAARRLIIAFAQGLKPSPPRPRAPRPARGSTFVQTRDATGIYVPWALRLAMRRSTPPDASGQSSGHPDGQNPDIRNNPDGTGKTVRPRRVCLPLFDPPKRKRRRAPRTLPRVWVPGLTRPLPEVPRPRPAGSDPLDAQRLGLRIAALRAALDDLPRQALRYARWRQADAVAAACPEKAKKLRRRWPLRRRLPVGRSRRATREVHEILARADALAIDALMAPDTS